MKFLKLTFLASVILISCNEAKKEEIKKEKPGFISVKWKQTKEIFVESDSTLKAREEKYYSDLEKQFPEYLSVKKWFLSKPKVLLGEKGDFYKMIKNEIDNNNTITHNDISKKSEYNTYKYLFVSENAYYIYDLEVIGEKCIYKGVRRIKKGFGKQPVHDLLFDEKLNLKKEVFHGKVSQDLYTKDDILYFEFNKKTQDQTVKNSIYLGKEKNF